MGHNVGRFPVDVKPAGCKLKRRCPGGLHAVSRRTARTKKRCFDRKRAMNETRSICVACARTSDDVPIVRIEYQGAVIGICPQHLPILIHDPTSLAGRLAGAESMRAADHHD